MDGIDAGLFSIEPRRRHEPGSTTVPDLDVRLIKAVLHPFEPLFQRRLQAAVAAPAVNWQQVCLLNAALGEVFAQAANRLIRETKSDVDGVDLIGSHGQTVWHAPEPTTFWGVRTKATLQLGEPEIIAYRTGVAVVGDFRWADVAVGGQGAPLVCFADEVLFGAQGIATLVLNVGGIGNITALDATGAAIMAFDTGPANVLIDRAAQILFQVPYDSDGTIARAGQIDEEWLSQLLSHQYLRQLPPKSTGRELFGNDFADQEIAKGKAKRLPPADCLATLTAFSAASIAKAYEHYVLPRLQVTRLIVGGGGAYNSYMMELLPKYWPHGIEISRTEDHGVSTKFKEALLFALLAYTTYFKIPNNVPACTGATRPVCLGKLVDPKVL
jgi:anhydro-N-acetylmuramic acid kinase